MVDLTAWQKPGSSGSRPDGSLLATILPVDVNNAILIYGPSKAGKTRLAAWEAAVLARHAGRPSVLYLVAEVNYTKADIADIVAACAKNQVQCEIDVVESHQAILDTIEYLRAKHKELLTGRKTRKKKGKIDIEFPGVVVIDSISGFSEHIIASLSQSEVGGGGVIATRYSTPILKMMVPLRAIINAIGGYVILTAQSTPTVMGRYKPWIRWLFEKPRFMGPTPYIVDAEVYVSIRGVLHSKLARKAKPATEHQMAVVVDSRRSPNAIGVGAAFRWTEEVIESRGVLREEETLSGVKYVYTPGDGDTIKARVLKPEVVTVADGLQEE